MDRADQLLRAGAVRFLDVDPAGAVATAAVSRYFAELDARFPSGFDPGTPTPPDSFTVATSGAVPVACGGVQRIADGVGEVKRMWVDPAWRGAGLGGRLLRHLEGVAAASGCGVVRLDTNGALLEAVALYGRAGYRVIERYNANPYAELFFEKSLTPTSPA